VAHSVLSLMFLIITGLRNNVNDKLNILIGLGVVCVLLSATAVHYAYEANNNAEYAFDAADAAYYEATECVKQR
jgi:hypothetical protein